MGSTKKGLSAHFQFFVNLRGITCVTPHLFLVQVLRYRLLYLRRCTNLILLGFGLGVIERDLRNQIKEGHDSYWLVGVVED